MFINRLESIRGLKDVKYVVYHELWKHRIRKCHKELYERFTWDDERMNWLYWLNHKNERIRVCFAQKRDLLCMVPSERSLIGRYLTSVNNYKELIYRNGKHAHLPNRYMYSSLINAKIT